MTEPIRPIDPRRPVVAPVELRALDPLEREARRRERDEARRRRRAARTPPQRAPARLDVRG